MNANLTKNPAAGLFNNVIDGEFNQLLIEAFEEVFSDTTPEKAPISLKKLVSDAHVYMNELSVDASISAESRIDFGKDILEKFYFFKDVLPHHSEAQLTYDCLTIIIEELIQDYNNSIKYCELD